MFLNNSSFLKFQKRFFVMDPPNEERSVAKRQSSSNVQELDISLTPEKKARIDAEESKITENSDLPDLDSKFLEAENLCLKQKIKELESKVNIRTNNCHNNLINHIFFTIFCFRLLHCKRIKLISMSFQLWIFHMKF